MEPGKEPMSDNEIHPYDTAYSSNPPIDDGTPSLNRKRAKEMKAAINVAKAEKAVIKHGEEEEEKKEKLKES